MKKATTNTTTKSLHPRNKHNDRYDFNQLITVYPELKAFVALNKFGSVSIDFANPEAVKALNVALLKQFYGIDYWDIPKTNLCPPIPGRADYIHYIADVLTESNHHKIPTGKNVRVLDIGVGANCIYPIIGHQEYGWTFVGTELDKPAKATAEKIISNNPDLQDTVSIRLQENKRNIFKNIIQPGETFDITICNPPFHTSREAATQGSQRKLKNLGKAAEGKPVLNFSGQNNELWCEGGELAFITNMIYESVHFKSQCLWFSTLVSKNDHLKNFYTILKKVKAVQVKTVTMEQGNKVSRILLWTFLEERQQESWSAKR
ncbi:MULTISPECIES: 23S rRNA (adenine(1618)-N(6))-methyltransferase RlmF [unclassified Flavobacterium]|uniref:23S rRNA (adenine(1618)-N(6))-methyltransferase RlmF n=1 Tax=unclassified Flavobacterium TaxID=196869 RepID=UPI00086CBCB2|nr:MULTISPECIES: 23S rRNA (adenine(1618)-N(6))-methyltransferase RlmF [unclassified Flavobacterium]MBN9286043.1 23S rRNA (adenine(1618)-N(6))-methyltransferase RlmF [Flavobacterium sp.]ODS81583.1 MAG: 23S rRNA (adenine(1618)-N(6))-methyltransferase [Chryseobacterium sp. SCN 40-13]OJV69096.1 MAG: 23S rRNA (adenine(1618)-N(6))-methyltransferase [Flavobacterium sp. 40-81]